ncbi:hypothetical protein J132_07664 [Termitomyces sp. J132]|nr:hypothetical protein H2248_008788 [Termitomyces sp. 'cryptogamus']KNZ73366.1 hypothetical protein J132_07664 [Termitomyces sp. J132]
MQFLSVAFVALSSLFYVYGLAPSAIEARQAPDNIVLINSANSFCLILPRDPHTNIGDSERPGGEKTYCSTSARKSSQQGLLPDQFWRQVAYKTGKGKNGKGYAQLTGCIRPGLVDRLNANDAGGQYDSDGGTNGKGNPVGSKCIGYKHYVELVEPAGPRACIRCCNDAADCPVITGSHYSYRTNIKRLT